MNNSHYYIFKHVVFQHKSSHLQQYLTCNCVNIQNALIKSDTPGFPLASLNCQYLKKLLYHSGLQSNKRDDDNDVADDDNNDENDYDDDETNPKVAM